MYCPYQKKVCEGHECMRWTSCLVNYEVNGERLVKTRLRCNGQCFTDSTVCGEYGLCPYTKGCVDDGKQ